MMKRRYTVLAILALVAIFVTLAAAKMKRLYAILAVLSLGTGSWRTSPAGSPDQYPEVVYDSVVAPSGIVSAIHFPVRNSAVVLPGSKVDVVTGDGPARALVSNVVVQAAQWDGPGSGQFPEYPAGGIVWLVLSAAEKNNLADKEVSAAYKCFAYKQDLRVFPHGSDPKETATPSEQRSGKMPPDLSGRYLHDLGSVLRQGFYNVPFIGNAAPLSTVTVEHVEDEEVVIRYEGLEGDDLVERVTRWRVGDEGFAWTRDGAVHIKKGPDRSGDFGVMSAKSSTKTLIRKSSNGDLVFDVLTESESFEFVCFLPVRRGGSSMRTIVLPRLPPDAPPVFRAKPVTRGTILKRLDVADENDVVMLNYNIRLKRPYSVFAWAYLRNIRPPSPIQVEGSLLPALTILSRGSFPNHDYILCVLDGQLAFKTSGSFHQSGAYLLADTPFPVDRWVSVIVTHEGETAKLYQDGKLVVAKTLGSGDVRRAAPTTVGGVLSPNLPSRVFDHVWQGSIAGLTVYDRALTPAEIEGMHSNGDHKIGNSR